MTPAVTRRAVLAGAAGLAAATLDACGHGGSANGRTSIRVYRHKLSAAHYMEAAGQATAPYHVEYVDLPGGPMVLNAFAADALDYSFMSEIPPIFAAQGKIPLKLIASFSGDVNNAGILVRPGLSLRRFEDLRGRTVSYVPSTNDHYYLLKLLAAYGMTTADIQPVPLPVLDANGAFQGGRVDARCCGGFTALFTERQLGGRWLVKTLRGLYSGNFVIAAHPRSLAEPAKRAAISDYVKREQATWRWVADHPAQWADIAARDTNAPRDIFDQLAREQSQPGLIWPVSGSVIADQQRVSDFLVEQRLIAKPVAVNSLWDHSIWA